MYSHGKSPHDCNSVLLGHSIEEIVPVKADAVPVFGVAGPRPSIVLVFFSANFGFGSNQNSSKVSQETIFLGRGTILKCGGTCEGQCKWRI